MKRIGKCKKEKNQGRSISTNGKRRMHTYLGNKTIGGLKAIGKIKMTKKTNINQEKQSEKGDKQQLKEDLLEEMGRNIETCLEFRLCGNAMFKMLRELGFKE